MTWVDNFEGERVDVETLSVEELERIAECLREEIAHPTHGQMRNWHETELEAVTEELEARARDEDREETSNDDERAGVLP